MACGVCYDASHQYHLPFYYFKVIPVQIFNGIKWDVFILHHWALKVPNQHNLCHS